MKISRQVVLVLVLLLLTTGCVARMNREMASWVGRHKNELIASWGPPQQVLSDGSDSEIYVYSQARQWNSPSRSTSYTTGTLRPTRYAVRGRANTYTTTYPSQAHQYTVNRMFWINQHGHIHRWSWKGL